MSPFAYVCVNLPSLMSAPMLGSPDASRPIAGKDFEFMFYLDFEASVYSDEVIALLCELDAEPTEFAYLGTYI